jgi:hypothetical protein
MANKLNHYFHSFSKITCSLNVRIEILIYFLGEFSSFLFNGLGKSSISNGIVYEGYWSNGLRHGRGCLTYPNGDKLIGILN